MDPYQYPPSSGPQSGPQEESQDPWGHSGQPAGASGADRPGGADPWGQPSASQPATATEGSRTLLGVAVVVVIVAVACLVALAVTYLGRDNGAADPDPAPSVGSADPTSDPTTADPTTASPTTADPTSTPSPAGLPTVVDGRVSSSDGFFSVPVPEGYQVDERFGDGNSAKLSNADSQLTVYDLKPLVTPDPEARCAVEMESLSIWVPGEITNGFTRQIGGRDAFGGELVGDDGTFYKTFCVYLDGRVFSASVESTVENRDVAAADLSTFLDGLVWE